MGPLCGPCLARGASQITKSVNSGRNINNSYFLLTSRFEERASRKVNLL